MIQNMGREIKIAFEFYWFDDFYDIDIFGSFVFFVYVCIFLKKICTIGGK